MVSNSQVERGVGRTLVVLSGAPFLASLDLFVVNVAFTAIGRDFRGHTLADLSWILNGYPIIYCAPPEICALTGYGVACLEPAARRRSWC
jgi:MFS family permease